MYHWSIDLLGLEPLTLNYTMFLASIIAMMTDEQRAKWDPLARKGLILGSYAQTELGHGSDVAGLETTATFDRQNDQFIVDTPTPTATKWWPGDLGLMCTHAVVFAKLIIDDNSYGVLPFMVQLRDTNSFMPLPGIKCGDMGPKIGFNSKNNGWTSFDKVRIPRENMMMKYTKVAKDGTFSIEGDTRVLYSVMMNIRT
jgi:acyl-CoA oxidase